MACEVWGGALGGAQGGPPFRPGVPSAACTFRPASAFRATVAKFHFRVASAVPEPAMSGPNGDLSMPVDAGAEGENDSFGEAGNRGGGVLPRLLLLCWWCRPGIWNGTGLGVCVRD